MRIAVIALGTRGDVQPLALLSWQLRHGTEALAAEVTLITHAAHQAWLEELLGSNSDVRLLYVSSSPAGVWQQQVDQSNNTNNSSSSSSDSSKSKKQRTAEGLDLNILADAYASSSSSSKGNRGNVDCNDHQPSTADTRLELLLHCCTALSCQWQHDSHHQQQQQQQSDCNPPQQQQQQRLVIFNLFALEGYHISEALQVPCLVAQPYLIPYSMPASFARRFRKSLPALYEALQSAHHHQHDSSSSSSSSSGSSRVTWKDVCHWMWPLFTERWGSWRHQQLHLDPLPVITAWQQQWKGCTYKAIGNVSSSSSSGCSQVTPRLPAAVPVLYGLSPSVVCAPGYWPSSVQLTGFWLATDMHAQTTWQQQQQRREEWPAAAAAALCQLPVELQRFLSRCRSLKDRKATIPSHHHDLQKQDHHHQQQQQHQYQQQQQDHDHHHCDHGNPDHHQQQRGSSSRSDHHQDHSLSTSADSAGSHPSPSPSPSPSPPAAAAAAAAAVTRSDIITSCKGVLLIDFGSMGLLGLITHPISLLTTIIQALQQSNWCGVLMTNGWQTLTDAYIKTLNPNQQQRLYLQQQSITCYYLLLQSVDVVLHHGGSGTTAAAAAAGVPQLICPLQFDQFHWAETMRDLGCSPQTPLSIKLLLLTKDSTAIQQHDEQQQQRQQQQQEQEIPSLQDTDANTADPAAAAAAVSLLVQQILAAREPAIVNRCRQLKESVAAEDGLHKAAEEVRKFLRSLQT